MRISIIVAAAENGVIGSGGAMPWRMPSDLRHFRALTLGKPVIMGRKTWQSLPKRPLDGRPNIVVTRNPDFEAGGAHVVPTLVEAFVLADRLARAAGGDEVFVIGGAQIYAAALPSARRIYLTRIHASPDGDATFPDPDAAEFREESRSPLACGPRDDHAATLIVYERRD
jgi:dihydrofolate reductase